jgi:hypothetical protein
MRLLLGVLVVVLVVGLWPRDAIPTFQAPPPSDGPYPMFADSSTAKFFRIVMPAYYALFFAVSPLGYVLWNIRRYANDLHRLRTRLAAWLRLTPRRVRRR